MRNGKLEVISGGKQSSACQPKTARAESNSQTPLTIIQGGRDELEWLFYKLLTQPHTFAQPKFEHLVNVTFKSRLSRAEVFDLTTDRLRNREDVDPLEQHAILAIIEGRDAEAKRLGNILKRRNQLGLKVLRPE